MRWEDLVALLVASALGAVVGIERELHGRPAGLRTHILLSLGAALFGIISRSAAPAHGDPTRIAAQVVTGVGFLGAGTILHLGGTVRGLTTAASIWSTAAIGLTVGLSRQHWGLAAAATGIAFVTLFVLHFLEDFFWRGVELRDVDIVCRTEEVDLAQVLEALASRRIEVEGVRKVPLPSGQQCEYRLALRSSSKTPTSEVVDILIQCKGVEEVRVR